MEDPGLVVYLALGMIVGIALVAAIIAHHQTVKAQRAAEEANAVPLNPSGAGIHVLVNDALRNENSRFKEAINEKKKRSDKRAVDYEDYEKLIGKPVIVDNGIDIEEATLVAVSTSVNKGIYVKLKYETAFEAAWYADDDLIIEEIIVVNEAQ